MMRTMGSLAVLVALVLCGPENSLAEQCTTTHDLVGFTSATFDGAQGVFTYTLACQAEFGGDARMCDSLEVLRTTNVPGGLAGSAWVRPFAVADGQDASKTIATACDGWTTTSGFGLRVDDSGSFDGYTSCTTTQSIACCVPIQTSIAPVVSSTRSLAYGVLAFLVLSIGGGALLFRGQAVRTLLGVGGTSIGSTE